MASCLKARLKARSRGRSHGMRLAVAALLASASGLGVGIGMAHAASPAVDALVKQAQYWRSKGREDLAEQAMRRARSLDPAVKAAAPAAAKPQPAKPQAKPQPAPQRTIAATPPKREPAPAPRKAEAPKPAPARVAATPPASVRAGQARVAGYDALNGGSLDTAGSQFQKALSVNRRDPEALGGLGLVRLRQKRFAEAADLLQQASNLGKASQWATGLAAAQFFAGLDHARGLLAQGQVEQAQAEAEHLVRSGYAQPAPAFELLGDIYDKQGRYADSAEFYRQALQGGAQDDARLQSRAARGRALAAAARGDDFNAEREFQNGLLLDRNDPWVRYEFARYQFKRGRVAEADGLLRALSSVSNPDSTYAAALLSNDMGRISEADRLMGMIPEQQRTAPMRSFAIGVKVDAAIARTKTLAAGGQQAQAVSVLRQLGQIPAVPTAKLGSIADALLDMGDQQGAVTLAQTALDSGTLDADGYASVIGVLTRTGREDLAQMALQRAGQVVGSSPEGQRAYARMGVALSVSQADRAREAGQFATAFDMLQASYTAAPDNTDVLAALGRLYQSGKMPERAAQTYQLVLSRKPRDKDALLGLASAAQAAGDRSLSERAQDDVLRAYPQDYKVRLALADVERARGDERGAVRMLKDARALYVGAGSAAAGANPFANMGSPGANPFRNQTGPNTLGSAPAAAVQVNPFALGGGTRLPQAQNNTGGAFMSPASYTYEAPPAYTAQSYPAAAAAPAYPQQSYPQQSYPQQAYPQQAYPQQQQTPYPAPAYPSQGQPAQGYPAPNYPDQGYPAQGYPAPAASGWGDNPGAPASGGYPADPVLAQIQSDIAKLADGSGPRADVGTSYRSRSGEKGLSKLDEIKGNVKLSTGLLGGRVYVGGEAVVIDSSKPTGSGLARFGRNGTPEAQAIVAEEESDLIGAQTQHQSGVAPAIGFESDSVQAEVGTTPIGMGKTKLTFRAGVSPAITPEMRLKAWVERKPVTDSVVSYAGADVPVERDPSSRDPVTGERWGQVMRTGGGVGISYDSSGNGFYAEGRYNQYRGENVRKNHGIEANAGGYLKLFETRQSRLTAGINVNYQKYDNSQNYFTYGHGGYFSPQDFLSVSLPMNYTMNTPTLEVKASLTPGFQTYSQDEVPLYPTDPAAQAELDRLKALNSDVRSYYDSLSQTGFAVAADASLYYRVGPNTRVGGELSYNTFGSYDEFRSTLGVRQTFGSAP